MTEAAHRAEDDAGSGGENLEVMREAENYNLWLREQVRTHGIGATHVLDFGAGIGTFSDAAGVPHANVRCVEPDAASRTVLNDRGFAASADLDDIEEQSIDYAFTLNVLEHIEDDDDAVRRLYSKLRPGGRIFVYVPAFACLFTSMDHHVGHVRRYRLPGLVALLEGAGFRIEQRGYADPLGFFATLLMKLFDSDEPAPLNPGLVRAYDRLAFPLSRLLTWPFSRVLGKNVYVVATRP